MLLRPLVTLYTSRPPGFEASPTLPLNDSGTPQRTPSPTCTRQLELGLGGLEELFAPAPAALLNTPASPPNVAPTTRRKTLAGVTISTYGGITIKKTNTRAGARKQKTVMEKQAQVSICRNLGIVKNAMRAFFRLDDEQASAAEAGLLDHGGATNLDHEEAMEQPAAS